MITIQLLRLLTQLLTTMFVNAIGSIKVIRSVTAMKIQRLGIALTVINLVLLTFLLSQMRPATAQGVAPVLRGRGLEIVDGKGRVRASLDIQPAETTATGESYPETVLFRLINEH